MHRPPGSGVALALASLLVAGIVLVSYLALRDEAPAGPLEQTARVVPVPGVTTPPPIPPEHMPAPFAEREVRRPDPDAAPVSQLAAFCADENWIRLSESPLRPTPAGQRTLGVDAAAWHRTLSSTRAGLASWMSQCQGGGGTVEIVANSTGEWLATYDPREGLRASR